MCYETERKLAKVEKMEEVIQTPLQFVSIILSQPILHPKVNFLIFHISVHEKNTVDTVNKQNSLLSIPEP